MSRRSCLAFAMPAVAACALVLTSCGEQTPGGLPAGGQPQSSAGSTPAAAVTEEPVTARDDVSDADDPIVVKIGEREFATNMAIYRKYDGAKGGPLDLQAPVAPAEELVGGKKQDYVSGTIYWSPETGAQIVRGQIHVAYLDNGGPTGQLGWPVGDEIIEGAAVFSDFQRGQIRLENQAIRIIEHTS
ncbi:hypothetical protein [Rhodococcus sp. IEGM 1408]|uniref:LGFP repeat-containing protein n=1 Tax=Rhodococcus sp. IEGM 1408 TaxID=3082220 RepID=UPI002952B949|nr:hypothetical protein [Rhodococcus sp. IEGM 1408]MDV8002606.1 hypothetical protein [Rhodococcus sp. IEGM 1408]